MPLLKWLKTGQSSQLLQVDFLCTMCMIITTINDRFTTVTLGFDYTPVTLKVDFELSSSGYIQRVRKRTLNPSICLSLCCLDRMLA